MTKLITTAEIEELKALASKATPEGAQGNRNWNCYPIGMDRENMRSFGFLGSHNKTPYITKNRAEFIAAANPDKILRMIDTLERAVEVIEFYGNTQSYANDGDTSRMTGNKVFDILLYDFERDLKDRQDFAGKRAREFLRGLK